MSRTSQAYASWPSPISAASLARGGNFLWALRRDGDDLYLLEDRAHEGGRTVLVRLSPGSSRKDVLPEGISVRSRVHEIGGGAFVARDGVVWYCDDADQRIYRFEAGQTPRPITVEPPSLRSIRYGDLQLSPTGEEIVCVRERHRDDGEPINDLVALDAKGDGEARVLLSGRDFYAAPRFDPKGHRMAWLEWDHPNMPWDGCELRQATWDLEAGLDDPRCMAGGDGESICQPAYDPDGVLHFISDRSGWWNLYALIDWEPVALAPAHAEFGGPQWAFGMSSYAFAGAGRIACVVVEQGEESLRLVRRGSLAVETLDLPYTWFGRGGELISDGDGTLYFIGGAPKIMSRLVRFRLDDSVESVLHSSSSLDLEPEDLSSPRSIFFSNADGGRSHAFYYPPSNKSFCGPGGELPPLIVQCHGGPTGTASTEFTPKIQYWTTRGFAVVDVNYRGSTGFGREFREAINGRSGIVEVEDCIAAAEHLRDEGLVDGERMIIRGGSAGGFIVLCAVVFHDLFAAGASSYGIADMEALARDTHKFESHYLDTLVGPYPEARETYRTRSPLHFAHQVSCPVILLQGLEDPVVPPSQAEVMVEALRAKKLPFAYLGFAGEGHGFRKAANIQRALEAELYFFGRVLGIEIADEVEPIEIENL